MATYGYKCPACPGQAILHIEPSEPPICTGNPARSKHRARQMNLIIETPNQPKTRNENRAMAKPLNICECNTQPTADPTVFESCGRLTKSRFAPGHDAKLKGLLIRLALAGESYKVDNGHLVVFENPAVELQSFGWGSFLEKAQAAQLAKITAQAAKADAVAERKAEFKAAKPSRVKAQTAEMKLTTTAGTPKTKPPVKPRRKTTAKVA